MPNAALVAYDLLILRRGAAAAFARRRDRLLLALMVTVGILFAWSAAGGIADQAAALPLALKALLAGSGGFAVATAVAARLGYLRAHSMVARQALQGGAAAVHAAFWGAPPLVAALAVFLSSTGGALEPGALLASYAGGAAAALGWRALRRQLRRWARRRRGGAARAPVRNLGVGTRRQRFGRLLIARSGLRTAPTGANLALFAGTGAMLGLCVPLRESGALPLPLLFASFAAVLLIGRAMRQHPPLLRYLLFLGIMPTGAALVPLLPVALLVIGFAAAAASLGALPLPWLVGGSAAFLLLFSSIALLRAFHYAAKSRQRAEFGVQIDFAVIAAAALMAPPFAPVLLAARLWTLHRAAAALRHSLG